MIEHFQTAVFTFGRFNPPTRAHRHLFEIMQKQMGDKYVFMSHTQDNKKNPLSLCEKINICNRLFPSITFGNSNVKTIVEAAKYLDNMGYDNVIYIAGDDRIGDFSRILNKYNNIEYHFDNINIINAGQRNGTIGIQNVSASALRERVANDDYNGFLEYYIRGIDMDNVYQTLRERLNT